MTLKTHQMKLAKTMRETSIGETVKFTKDLHCNYSVNEIENLTVYNPLLKRFEKCEDWSSDDKTDCLFIGGFNANIDDKALFYFGTPIEYGCFPKYPHKLLFIPPGHTLKSFVSIGRLTFEKEYKKPSTMWDLGMYIDNYIFRLKSLMQNMIWAHQEEMAIPYNQVQEEDNDLPF